MYISHRALPWGGNNFEKIDKIHALIDSINLGGRGGGLRASIKYIYIAVTLGGAALRAFMKYVHIFIALT